MQEEDGLTNWGSTSREELDSFNYKAQYDQITKREQGLGEKQSWIPIEINISIEIKGCDYKLNHSKMDLKDITIRDKSKLELSMKQWGFLIIASNSLTKESICYERFEIISFIHWI